MFLQREILVINSIFPDIETGNGDENHIYFNSNDEKYYYLNKNEKLGYEYIPRNLILLEPVTTLIMQQYYYDSTICKIIRITKENIQNYISADVPLFNMIANNCDFLIDGRYFPTFSSEFLKMWCVTHPKFVDVEYNEYEPKLVVKNNIVNCSFSKSESLKIQMIGRGDRLKNTTSSLIEPTIEKIVKN